MYKDLVKNYDNIKASLLINFVQGAKVEILSPIDAEYKVEFINKKTGQTIHSSVIKNNCWTKCLYEYFIDWNVKVYQREDDRFVLIEDYDYNAKDKRVYIAMDSKAVGDTLSWFPYIDEFRKKHNCKVVCSTFHNYLFEKQYPEIEFIKPGEVAHNLYAMYSLGWFYKDDKINGFKVPNDFKTQPLQKTASDILGIDFVEVKPKLPKFDVEKKKQVAIAIHSTAQAKYWNNLTGWQEVVDWLKNEGYNVKLLSREGDTYMGNKHPEGIEQVPHNYTLEDIIKELNESQAFIGISSGLSWVSWATDTPTILVSGFTEEYTEPTSCYRIGAPEGKCRGCFNSHQLNAGDWNWCPMHKDTERQFECTKSITSDQVIKALKNILGQ